MGLASYFHIQHFQTRPKRPLSKPDNLCQLRPSNFCPLPVSPHFTPNRALAVRSARRGIRGYKETRLYVHVGGVCFGSLFPRALSFAGTAAEGTCVTCTWTTAGSQVTPAAWSHLPRQSVGWSAARARAGIRRHALGLRLCQGVSWAHGGLPGLQVSHLGNEGN